MNKLHSQVVVTNYARAGILMSASTFCFAAMAAFIKHYINYPLSQALFIRSIVALLSVLLIIFFQKKFHEIKTTRPQIHIIRATFGLLAMACTFHALRVIPIADASAFFRAKALFMIPLAILLLKENIKSDRLWYTFLGFCGVLVMLNPSAPTLSLGVLAALCAAILAALAMITVRNLGSTESTLSIVFYFMLISTFLTLPFAISNWINIATLSDFFGLAAIGISGLIGQLFMVAAYRNAEASFVGPLDYLTLIWSVLLGWIFWDEIPTLWIVSGALIVLYSQLRMQLKRKLQVI